DFEHAFRKIKSSVNLETIKKYEEWGKELGM
nr:hypothetical protein [Candidatus Aenigmarchaeota archaeon]NIP40095.1 hypothetical protein [Candidatus Aenigmarchaeota archaeon]NIQ18172.1 hypothetical protein [Candidatus Aenigmarchaeota archaeon]NIS72929.1 hypothetical protein [Candidatus Aenigmarchaeota archaeon]